METEKIKLPKKKICKHENIWYVNDSKNEESEIWCKDCGKFLGCEEYTK